MQEAWLQCFCHQETIGTCGGGFRRQVTYTDQEAHLHSLALNPELPRPKRLISVWIVLQQACMRGNKLWDLA